MTEEEVLRIARCCPFCGSHDLNALLWSKNFDDRRDFDVIECDRCKSVATIDVWNHRLEDPDEPGWPPRMQ